jgi:hypothetical protein
MDKITADIEKGKELKSAETVDKSVPLIDPSVQVGKNPMGDLKQEIKKPVELKHAETVDKSAPTIECVFIFLSHNLTCFQLALRSGRTLAQTC